MPSCWCHQTVMPTCVKFILFSRQSSKLPAKHVPLSTFRTRPAPSLHADRGVIWPCCAISAQSPTWQICKHSITNITQQIFTQGLLQASTLIEEAFGPAVLTIHVIASALGAALLQTLLLPSTHTISGPGETKKTLLSQKSRHTSKHRIIGIKPKVKAHK